LLTGTGAIGSVDFGYWWKRTRRELTRRLECLAGGQEATNVSAGKFIVRVVDLLG
jgi:hypothetical protein